LETTKSRSAAAPSTADRALARPSIAWRFMRISSLSLQTGESSRAAAASYHRTHPAAHMSSLDPYPSPCAFSGDM
jgi:hypothetical protein